MSACLVIAVPGVGGRSFVGPVVEPLYDQSAVGGTASDFDADFSIEFGSIVMTAEELFNAVLRDERGFPLFDETPETGDTVTVTSVTKTTPCKKPAIDSSKRSAPKKNQYLFIDYLLLPWDDIEVLFDDI